MNKHMKYGLLAAILASVMPAAANADGWRHDGGRHEGWHHHRHHDHSRISFYFGPPAPPRPVFVAQNYYYPYGPAPVIVQQPVYIAPEPTERFFFGW